MGDRFWKDMDLWQQMSKKFKPMKKSNHAPASALEKSVNLKEKPPTPSAPASHSQTPLSARQEQPSKLGEFNNIKNSGSMNKKRNRLYQKGQQVIDATLDLHGMTLSQAQEAVNNFVTRNYSSGKRNLLIITGKGREFAISGIEGEIKKSFPRWADNLKQYIIYYKVAHRSQGGEGAYCVFLRKSTK